MTTKTILEFTSARPQDAGPIRDLVRAAYQRWVPVIGREPRPMVADYEKAVRDHEIDLAHLDGRLVGLIETIACSDHLWIENVAVHPDAQGNGLGKALLARAEAKATDARLPETRLLTNAAFEVNIALYEKTGYVITRSEPFMGGTTIHMTKRLAP